VGNFQLASTDSEKEPNIQGQPVRGFSSDQTPGFSAAWHAVPGYLLHYRRGFLVPAPASWKVKLSYSSTLCPSSL
jgi:hypothetical protein